MSFGFAAPISITRFFDFGLAFMMLKGIPISLLKFLRVLELLSKELEIILVVVVFPLLPVMPITLP